MKTARLQNAVFLVSSLLLLRRMPSLYRISSRSGLNAVVMLLMMAIARPFHQETRITLVGIVLGLGWSFYSKSSTLLRWIVAFGSSPVLGEALRGEDADIPAVLAIILGLLLDHVKASSIILVMVTGGEALEESAINRAGSALHSLLKRSPGLAKREIADGETELIPSNLVKAEDVVLVSKFEVIPVDGTLVESNQDGSNKNAFVDERLLTGELQSVEKVPGQLVMAGTISQSNGVLRIRAKGGWEDSILNQMRSSLHTALEERKSNLELSSMHLADIMTPLTLAMAALTFAIHAGRSSYDCWQIILSIFMSATPCPARIGVPIAMLSGMSVSTKLLGATIKSASALETLSQCSVLCLDKTGTITVGSPALKHMHIEHNMLQWTQEMIFDAIVSLELMAPKHVLRDAIVAARQATFVEKISHFQHFPGQGIEGVVQDKFRIRIGSRSFVQLDSKSGLGHQLAVYFSFSLLNSSEHVISGMMILEDSIRAEAFEFIRFCQNELGLRVVLLSGDESEHLRYCAQQLAISEFHVCLPHEKAEYIHNLQQQQGALVCFVGDGANDSPALASANVGISLDATNMASEAAQIVVLNGELGKVKDLIHLSRFVLGIATRTVRYGMLASFVQMMVAFSGKSSPFVNAVAQELIDLSSVFHALLVLGYTKH